jgi:hypothetical protein
MAERLEEQYKIHGTPQQLDCYSVERARSGKFTLRYTTTGQDGVYLHSPYDPLREAEQYADRLLEDYPEGSLTVIFGLGLGYQALQLAARLPQDERIIVIEPHWELIYLAFCHMDLRPLLTRQNLTITSNTTGAGLLSHMNSVELAGFKGLRLASNPSFERLPLAGGYSDVANRLRYEMMAVGGNLQTLMVMGEMQQMNILLNFEQILHNPPFRNLIGRFSGRPAVIVSAGPSLEKNMHRLKELSDRALIIAVDTATKPLIRAGVTPHLVVTGDPQEANARHLWDVDLPETYLIAEPQSPVSAVARWTGKRFICSFHDNMMQWVDKLLGDRGRLNVWGSVAVMAWDTAVKLDCDPIVFIGQDLSFPGGRTYASGTYFETEEHQEMTAEQLKLKGETLIEMTDIFGESVLTNRQMYAYFNYLSDQFLRPDARNRKIINATEGGILHGPQVTVMSLDEAISEYMQSPWDVMGQLASSHAIPDTYMADAALAETERMLGELRRAAESCHRGVEFVTRTIDALKSMDETASSQDRAELEFRRMCELRRKMLQDKQVMKIVEMANHSGIYSFTQGLLELQRAEKAGNDPDKLRHCYHHHTLYSSTGAAIERLIPLFEHCRDALIAQQSCNQRHQVGAANLVSAVALF